MLAEFIFTDGVGCVSLEFAKKMAQKFGIPKGTPSCFQVVYYLDISSFDFRFVIADLREFSL